MSSAAALKLAAANGKRSRLVVLTGVALIVLTILMGLRIWANYRETIRSAEIATLNYTAIIERDFDTTLSRIDANILELKRTIPDAALNRRSVAESAAAIDANLDLRRYRFPELGGLRIFDAAGDLLYTTGARQTSRVNEGDQAYFREARDHRETDLIYETSLSRASGRPSLLVARALRTPSGTFRGVAAAEIELDYFQNLFSSLEIGDGGYVAIFRQDDYSTVTDQSRGRTAGNGGPRRLSSSERDLIGTTQTAATLGAVSDVDGSSYILSMRALERYPFSISVALSRDEVLAAWKIRSAIATGLLLLMAFLQYRLWRADAKQQKAIADLADSEANLRAISENANVGILIRVDGRIVFTNRRVEEMLGYSAEEFGRLSLADIMYPDDRPIVLDRHRRRLAGEDVPSRYEARFLAKDGRAIPVEINGAVTRWNGRNANMGVFNDIRERKEAEAERLALESQLREAQKMEAIGKLTGGMAHDFNNYLGVIIGNLDLLEERNRNDPDAAKLVSAATDGALRSAALTQSLLAFARRQPLAPRRIDLNRALAAVATLLTRTLGEDIVLRTDLAPNVWPVRIDGAQLDSCIVNLANNARDAMPQGGTLTIATRNVQIDALYAEANPDVIPGDYVLVEISDTGAGMTPETTAHAFDPFFSTKPVGHGTGLGLSMVYGFTKQSNGNVKIYSEAGHGTTVRLYLPRHRNADEASAVAEAAHAAPVGGTETILIVEDNEKMRRTVEAQLTMLGYRVIEAEHGPAAMEILNREECHVDLLFTDIVMPGGFDGYELAARATERHPRLKILLTSGFPGETLQGNDHYAERIDLLGKPYRLDQLVNAVRRTLDTQP